jgi:hypothetical protein
MRRQIAEKTVHLTSEFMEAFYSGNPEPVFAVASPDITWIGAQKEQFDIGFEKFRADIEKVLLDLPPCYLSNQRYLLAQNNGSICTVIGSYYVMSRDNAEHAIAGEQRCVAIWRLSGEQLSLVHLSNSSPIGEWMVTEGEHFPSKMSAYIKNYIRHQVREKLTPRQLVITDTVRVMHFISESEIYYLESDDKYTEIYLADSTIRTRMQLKEFLPKLSPVFLKISRINIVNMSKIARFSERDAILLDGRSLPVPAKKMTEIKKTVSDFFNFNS